MIEKSLVDIYFLGFLGYILSICFEIKFKK
jgi:hypothetical protein